jgi:hypothetical protein
MADTNVDRLLKEYIAAHRAGEEADPREWLARVEGRERTLLAAMIDRYLERAPAPAWDPDAFARSGLGDLAERIDTSLQGQAGTWPAVLPELSNKARLKRSDVVARLAAALGVPEKQEKVGSYYHEMERGLLPAEGVQDRVLEALGSILGQSAEALRAAGKALSPRVGGEPAGPVAFARAARVDPEYPVPAAAAMPPPSAAPGGADDAWDEVDRLFRGG